MQSSAGIAAFYSRIDWISTIESIGALVGIVAVVFSQLIPWVRAYVRRIAVEGGLSAELYPPDAVDVYTRYYIEPAVQTLDPEAAADEPGFMVASREAAFSALDRVLASPTQFRYVVILAGSGMGKSSLLVNYYARNQRRWRRHFEIALIPLGIPDADERISNVPRKASTVLFLDALDEDARAINNHKDRLESLISATSHFRKVVLTCRTQFFSSAEEEPGDAGMIKIAPRAAGQRGGWHFHKVYLSPFDTKEVTAYLRKRFPIWRYSTRRRAQQLIETVPNLVVRPMLLAYIDYLLQNPNRGVGLDDLYSSMIDAWLEREEGIFPDIQKAPLLAFSRKLAVNLWLNRDVRGAERIPGNQVELLAREYGIPIGGWQLTGRSLLNRDVLGNYKFAHRSILEYLVVEEFLAGNRECWTIDWTDQMHRFVRSIIATKPLNGEVMLGPVALGAINLSYFGPDPEDPRKMAAVPLPNESDDAGTLKESYRDLGTKHVFVLLPDSVGVASPEQREQCHLVQPVSVPSGKVWIDHSAGLAWFAPDTTRLTQVKATRLVYKLDSEIFLGLSGWRVPTWKEFLTCTLNRVFSEDWCVVQTFDGPTDVVHWRLAAQMTGSGAFAAMLASPRDDSIDIRQTNRRRYAFIADL
jgi:hypothetical protein